MSNYENALLGQYRRIGERMQKNPDMDVDTMRDMLGDRLQALASEPADVTYEDYDAVGVQGILVKPLGAADDRIIVYTHGGGGVTGSASSHRKLAGHLASQAGVRSFVVDYRLAPENPFPAAVDDVATVLAHLREAGYKAEHTAAAGDSAGGNLAITAALHARENGAPLPAAVIAFSPWVDMEQSGETMKTNADVDAVLSFEMSDSMAAMYVGETPRSHPLVNALYADFTGMPPMHLSVGSVERLHDMAQAAGGSSELDILPDMQHVSQFMAGRHPVVDANIADVARWLRPLLGL